MWVILHHLTGKECSSINGTRRCRLPCKAFFAAAIWRSRRFFCCRALCWRKVTPRPAGTSASLTRFAVARFARIYPAYLLSLVLVSWFVFEFLSETGTQRGAEGGGAGRLRVRPAGLDGISERGMEYARMVAFLRIFFYLCFPLLFLWLGRGGLLRILGGAGGMLCGPDPACPSGCSGIWKPIHHLSDFVAGIAAARIYDAMVQSGTATKWLGFWLSAGGACGWRGLHHLSACSGRHRDESEYCASAHSMWRC